MRQDITTAVANIPSPHISIVIPTRNRAHLLRHALRSALEQTAGDYEVVVSDNHSSDSTPAVIREFACPRLRYVRPTQSLSMPDHWEFALDQVRGRVVTYLCDDDALAPSALEEVERPLAVAGTSLVVVGTADYYGDNWHELVRRNSLVIPVMSGYTAVESSRNTLAVLKSCQNTFDAPRMLNSFCRRDVLDRIRSDVGRVFFLAPDYSFAALVLAVIPNWTYIRRPLRIQGVFNESTGADQSTRRGEASQNFIRELGEEGGNRFSPLPQTLLTSILAETMLAAKHRLPLPLKDFEVDWEQFFLGAWADMKRLQAHGVDITTDRAAFADALSKQSAGIRLAVKRTLRRPWGVIRRAIERLVTRSRPLLATATRWHRNARVLWGDTNGFQDIFMASRLLPTGPFPGAGKAA